MDEPNYDPVADLEGYIEEASKCTGDCFQIARVSTAEEFRLLMDIPSRQRERSNLPPWRENKRIKANRRE